LRIKEEKQFTVFYLKLKPFSLSQPPSIFCPSEGATPLAAGFTVAAAYGPTILFKPDDCSGNTNLRRQNPNEAY